MEKSTHDQSPMSSQKMLEPSGAHISLQESQFGIMPSTSPTGETDWFGPAPALAPVSAPQEKAKGLQTLVTSGHIGYASSGSAALQSLLESKLQQRLDTAGSTLFTLTWKRRRTPLGRSYLERQALERRTNAKDCTSVPILASVPTPMVGSPATETYNAAGNNDYSRKIVELASIQTPTQEDHKSDGPRSAKRMMDGEALTSDLRLRNTVLLATCATPRSEDSQCAVAHRGTADTLHSQTNLCSVASPSARDWKDTSGMSETGVDPDGSIRTRLDQLPRQAQLADSGATATGGTPATKSTGQLNAAYSRWLQGLPAVFDKSAILAWRNLKTRRKRES